MNEIHELRNINFSLCQIKRELRDLYVMLPCSSSFLHLSEVQHLKCLFCEDGDVNKKVSVP
jgi:hypothetical protein